MKEKNKTIFTKKFGAREKDLNFVIKTTTWDGVTPVWVTTPKNPTEKQKKDTSDFLLHELDDHDAYNEYFKKLKGFK